MSYNNIVLGIALLSTLWIIRDDFKYRLIHIAPFILLGVSGLAWQGLRKGWAFLPELGFSLLIISLLLGGMSLWHWIRQREQVIGHKFGWGDVLMMGVVSIWLPPLVFLYAYTGLLLLLSLLYLLLHKLKKMNVQHSVPLAAWMGMALIFGFPLYHFWL